VVVATEILAAIRRISSVRCAPIPPALGLLANKPGSVPSVPTAGQRLAQLVEFGAAQGVAAHRAGGKGTPAGRASTIGVGRTCRFGRAALHVDAEDAHRPCAGDGRAGWHASRADARDSAGRAGAAIPV